MAGSFSEYLEDEVIDHIFGIGTFSSPVLSIALYTTTPTDVADSGAEVTDANDYARTADQAGTANWTTSAAGITKNRLNIDFDPCVTNTWGAVEAMAITNSAVYDSGDQQMWGSFTPVTIAVGDTARFPATTGIVVSLD